MRRLPGARAALAALSAGVAACLACRPATAAPLNYFLHALGPAATPTMYFDWAIAALSVAVCVIIGALLIGAMMHRRPFAEPRAVGADRGGMAWIYIGVGISTVALMVIMIYMLITLAAVAKPPTTPALSVTVTAYDWWWRFDYGGDAAHPGEHFVTANEMHIPVGQPVHVLLKSADVIHAFWVPQLAGKTQTIPGQTNEQWLQADAPGVYRGQCTQYCGVQHAHMAFEVIAQPPAEFAQWLAAQASGAAPVPPGSPLQAGQKVFMQRCAGCHTVRGSAADGAQAPDLTHLASRRMLAAGTLPNTPANLARWIAHAQQIKPGALMPDISLSAADAAALDAYLQTLR